MTAIDTDTTLARLVSDHPALARELERLGLDYCCGGTRTLATACAERGLDGADVATRLEAASRGEAPAAWATMGPTELVDHLEATHHRYLWDEMPRLDALAQKVAAVNGERHAELHDVARLVQAFQLDMGPHLMKEERILFPMIRELMVSSEVPEFHCGTLANPISVMLHEHDQTGAVLQQLRAATSDFTAPDDACASYRELYRSVRELVDDTHLHLHKENNLLFPMVLEREARPRAR